MGQNGQITYFYFQSIIDELGNDKTRTDALDSDIPEITSEMTPHNPNTTPNFESDFLLDTETEPFDAFDPGWGGFEGFTFNPEMSTHHDFTYEPDYTSDGFTFPPDSTFDPSTNYPWTTPYPYDFTTDQYFSAFTVGKDFLPVKSATPGATGIFEYSS